MYKAVFLCLIILSQLTAYTQSLDEGKNKNDRNFHAKEANKVIETRGSRVKANSKKQQKNKAEEQKQLRKKKKTRRKSTKSGNFGFY